eukprot:TRINITY_DN2279_c0_g1_i1.p1 TRINITY_DN2279_c0_g1~~TRINITY_DN2279_c0_g1_i1.p1  ORF type:complete len:1367 (+),score=310.22 TRINITY_DN2279_c0_g1_i1:110-4210(+)
MQRRPLLLTVLLLPCTCALHSPELHGGRGVIGSLGEQSRDHGKKDVTVKDMNSTARIKAAAPLANGNSASSDFIADASTGGSMPAATASISSDLNRAQSVGSPSQKSSQSAKKLVQKMIKKALKEEGNATDVSARKLLKKARKGQTANDPSRKMVQKAIKLSKQIVALTKETMEMGAEAAKVTRESQEAPKFFGDARVLQLAQKKKMKTEQAIDMMAKAMLLSKQTADELAAATSSGRTKNMAKMVRSARKIARKARVFRLKAVGRIKEVIRAGMRFIKEKRKVAYARVQKDVRKSMRLANTARIVTRRAEKTAVRAKNLLASKNHSKIKCSANAILKDAQKDHQEAKHLKEKADTMLQMALKVAGQANDEQVNTGPPPNLRVLEKAISEVVNTELETGVTKATDIDLEKAAEALEGVLKKSSDPPAQPGKSSLAEQKRSVRDQSAGAELFSEKGNTEDFAAESDSVRSLDAVRNARKRLAEIKTKWHHRIHRIKNRIVTLLQKAKKATMDARTKNERKKARQLLRQAVGVKKVGRVDIARMKAKIRRAVRVIDDLAGKRALMKMPNTNSSEHMISKLARLGNGKSLPASSSVESVEAMIKSAAKDAAQTALTSENTPEEGMSDHTRTQNSSEGQVHMDARMQANLLHFLHKESARSTMHGKGHASEVKTQSSGNLMSTQASVEDMSKRDAARKSPPNVKIGCGANPLQGFSSASGKFGRSTSGSSFKLGKKVDRAASREAARIQGAKKEMERAQEHSLKQLMNSGGKGKLLRSSSGQNSALAKLGIRGIGKGSGVKGALARKALAKLGMSVKGVGKGKLGRKALAKLGMSARGIGKGTIGRKALAKLGMKGPGIGKGTAGGKGKLGRKALAKLGIDVTGMGKGNGGNKVAFGRKALAKLGMKGKGVGKGNAVGSGKGKLQSSKATTRKMTSFAYSKKLHRMKSKASKMIQEATRALAAAKTPEERKKANKLLKKGYALVKKYEQLSAKRNKLLSRVKYGVREKRWPGKGQSKATVAKARESLKMALKDAMKRGARGAAKIARKALRKYKRKTGPKGPAGRLINERCKACRAAANAKASAAKAAAERAKAKALERKLKEEGKEKSIEDKEKKKVASCVRKVQQKEVKIAVRSQLNIEKKKAELRAKRENAAKSLSAQTSLAKLESKAEGAEEQAKRASESRREKAEKRMLIAGLAEAKTAFQKAKKQRQDQDVFIKKMAKMTVRVFGVMNSKKKILDKAVDVKTRARAKKVVAYYVNVWDMTMHAEHEFDKAKQLNKLAYNGLKEVKKVLSNAKRLSEKAPYAKSMLKWSKAAMDAWDMYNRARFEQQDVAKELYTRERKEVLAAEAAKGGESSGTGTTTTTSKAA